MHPKRLMKIFEIHPKYLIKESERNKWINIIRDLSNYDEQEIRTEYDRLLGAVGPDYPRYFYLDAVRKNLIIHGNDRRKRENMPTAIKDLFK